MTENIYSCFHYHEKCKKDREATEKAASEAKGYAESINPETFVSKNGDTMTGNLKITRNSTPVLDQQNTSDDRDVAPSTSAGTNYIRLTDKNNNTIVQFSNERIKDGRNTAKIQAFGVGGENAPALRVHAYADGRQGCQFPMCTTKATTTSSARSDLVAVVVQNYKNGKNWYRVWSDGWIEQGGITNAKANTITFLKAFSDSNYCFIHSQGGADTNEDASSDIVRYDIRTATSITVYKYGAHESCWYACGY